MSSAPSGPVVFAYDGSELAKMAIAESAGVLNHGRTGLASVLLGSVAEAVAAHSRRSVLIVHRHG